MGKNSQQFKILIVAAHNNFKFCHVCVVTDNDVVIVSADDADIAWSWCD